MGEEGYHSNTLQSCHSDVMKDTVLSKASFTAGHHKPAHLTGAKAAVMSALSK